ncbi:PREDICTED: calmodulin-binding transcription activator 4-like isoform X2 [Tarenaya hassleriana]|uniref:calmodulin-binding transcription activator 4-like isoform X2 n=1 Tax=Tarenaya hassleriana TaxID=28532 RepID=UPI00053C993C|nr:PREDICTED: calmodulin-binding transcription activator 4-like isoform X2 [Tarenaya hassleriana]
MQQSGYDVNNLYQEAQTRWLKPAEVLFILQSHERYQLTPKAPQKPTSGSLFLFNKRVLKFFRKDGHQWRRKKDGRAVAEAHERLKVGNAEALNCYYAHGELNPSFQRRSYWMLDPAYEHIVLVHYRDVSEGKEGKQSSGQILHFSLNSSSFFSSPSSTGTQNTTHNHYVSDSAEFRQHSSSPGSAEVSSETVLKSNQVPTPADSTSSSEFEVRQALRRLEEQLSLGDDNVDSVDPLFCQNENIDNLGFLECRGEIPVSAQTTTVPYQPESNKLERCYGGYVGNQDHSNNLMLVKNDSGGIEESGDEETESWKDMLEACDASLVLNTEEIAHSSERLLPEVEDDSDWNYITQTEPPSYLFPRGHASFEVPAYSSALEAHENNDYGMMGDQGQVGMSLEQEVSLTVAQKQKFTIQEISPEWGYANETTKVIIVGSFLCDPTESTWSCMFGSTEVPLQIIKEGVIRCEAPPCPPGKVTLCITSRNRVSCSQIREFEYRDKASEYCTKCNIPQTSSTTINPDEQLLLVRFVQMLLPDTQSDKTNNLEPDTDKWSHVIEAILDGNATSPSTVERLLQELIRDKLHSWLSSRSQREEEGSLYLSKKEQGIIHMVAGLGFEWALNPILSHGVGVDFRDINGWSALHWAARFGREKMVAALIASGASPGALTDPSSQDPIGKTAASIAASNGHKGLAGYLSEVALTNHLSSLTLEETEISKGTAEVQAEITVSSIPNPSSEDQLSLKDTLAAVRNSAQAAARIQAAFRAHSFRKRQQREAAMAACLQEFGIHSGDLQGLSAMSKLAFGNARDYNSAALSIQKKYRGWKGRKDFLALRHKVVKIQAHVRGYQVRKQYKVICWAVGILDKVVLRWRRKGAGLRGFRQDAESTDESDVEEDILKVFRKQKVDETVNKAFSRVLSMVKSPDAQQQYRRMLERYYQAKAELGTSEIAASASGDGDDELFDISDMLKEDLFMLP